MGMLVIAAALLAPAAAIPAPALPSPLRPVGPFILFFAQGGSDIGPDAAAILDNVAAAWLSSGNARVILVGNTDRSGSADYNIALSEKRVASVRAYLVGRGVPDAVISGVAQGEEQPLVETADGAVQPQNRNVQIFFGPASGP